MQNSYNKHLISESSQQLNETIISNRKMTENSLRMRAMAYLAQAKANLLIETIFEVEQSRKNLDKELMYKEEMVLAQSRHAAMGEMISLIAHQWKQPLSIISMNANNILADIELDELNEDKLLKSTHTVLEQTQELSNIIDDFRNFFKPTKRIDEVYISDIVNNTLKIISSTLKAHNIKIDIESQDTIKIKTYSRELMQVLINIINNARDALVEKKIKNPVININETISFNRITLEICDNGGGIDEKIIDKIFEPYFTTKDDKGGTGLGLYMSKTIIEKHLLGSLNIHNRNGGACFEISLPLTIIGRGENSRGL